MVGMKSESFSSSATMETMMHVRKMWKLVKRRPIKQRSFIRHLNSRFITYTDGSAAAWAQNGGAQMVIIDGNYPHEATARSSHYLIIRRRENGNVHNSQMTPTIARSRGHTYCRRFMPKAYVRPTRRQGPPAIDSRPPRG